MRKIRSDSKLNKLTREQREELAAVCDGEGVEAAKAYALARWNISISISGISVWHDCWRMREQFSSLSQLSREAARLNAEPDATSEELEKTARKIFTNEARRKGNVKEFVQLENLRLAQESAETRFKLEKQKLALRERQIAIMEKKVADAEKVAGDTTLTAEQTAQRMREIFQK